MLSIEIKAENQSLFLPRLEITCELSINLQDRSRARFKTNPYLFEKVYKSLHRAVVERFPFNIFYLVEGKSIIVVAVIHGSRHPKKWQKRI